MGQPNDPPSLVGPLSVAQYLHRSMSEEMTEEKVAEDAPVPSNSSSSTDLATQLDKTNDSLGKILMNVDTADKIAKLTKSLDEHKRMSAMERDALLKELDDLKKMQAGKVEHEKDEQKAESNAQNDTLVSLRNEFEEFKRFSTAERDSLARELNVMKELKRKEEEAALDAEDEIAHYKDVGLLDEDDIETRQHHAAPAALPDKSANVPSPKEEADKYSKMRQCETDVKNQVEGGVQSMIEKISEQFDEEGYLKCCMPEK